MSTPVRRTGRVMALPPPGYEVLRTGRRHYPVRLHLDDPTCPAAHAFTRPDGSVVSFAKRTAAILYLYQQRDLGQVIPSTVGATYGT